MNTTRRLLPALLLIPFAATACDNVFGPGPAPEPTWSAVPLDERVTDAYTGFGFELFRQLRAEDPDGNVFVSPTSAAFALTMTYNGAVGQTADEMAAALGIDHLDRDLVNETNRAWLDALVDVGDPRAELAIANSIWADIRFPFRETFVDRVDASYDAVARELDFGDPAAPDAINAWVHENTRGRIDEIIDEIDPNIIAYLINALYFQADWTFQFDRSETVSEPFHRPDGSTVNVPMMRQTGDLELRRDEDASMLRLPYGHGRFSMVLALPHVDGGLADLADRLTKDRWATWMDDEFVEQEVMLGLPRFEVEWKSSLKETLMVMGMENPFTSSADFSDMFATDGIFIDDVVQKTFLRVDEEGTEAAAVTKVGMRVVSGPPMLTFDRPFFLAIYDHATETVLFLGQITDPS